MKPQLIATALILVVAFYYFAMARRKRMAEETDAGLQDLSQPPPFQKKRNDKLILVKNVSHADMQKVLTGFCKMYNAKQLQLRPRLTKLDDDREFAITFPYDLEFEIFCYFVNYLKYPMELKWSPDITAWATTKSDDMWITERSANKRVMLFIPADDTEYDNVYLTTEDNIGYKLGFADGEEKQLLAAPAMRYVEPKIEVEALEGKDEEDLK